MKKLFTLPVLLLYSLLTHAAAETPVLKVHMHTAFPMPDEKFTQVVDGEIIECTRRYENSDTEEYAKSVYTHAEHIRIPQVKNIRNKDIYKHLNDKQQKHFNLQYNEGRLYLNGKDISSSAVPVAGFLPPHIKEQAK